MRIKYPLSFCIMLAAIIVAASMSVVFGHLNAIGLIFAVSLIIALRFAAHWEARKHLYEKEFRMRDRPREL